MASASARFKLDSTDWQKIWKSFLITVVGAVVAGVLTALQGALQIWFTDLPNLIDWGSYSTFVAMLCPMVGNFLIKLLKNNQTLIISKATGTSATSVLSDK